MAFRAVVKLGMLLMHAHKHIAENCIELMHRRMDQPDWNRLTTFLETTDTSSLSAAARKLGSSQATPSRQVATIERQLGVTRFERVGKALVLTGTGLALLDHARALGSAANDPTMAANGQSQAVDSAVCIAAGEMVAAHLQRGALPRLRKVAPGVVSIWSGPMRCATCFGARPALPFARFAPVHRS